MKVKMMGGQSLPKQSGFDSPGAALGEISLKKDGIHLGDSRNLPDQNQDNLNFTQLLDYPRHIPTCLEIYLEDPEPTPNQLS